MKIVKLTAENIKRLSAVSITPEGQVVVIGGDNGQGKTSVLDAIEMALAGKGSIPEEPIRRGAEGARVVVETDELVVTRRFTPNNSYLEVATREGQTFKSPQAILDKLAASLAFDPLAFMAMRPLDQAAELRRLVGLDTATLDDERDFLYGKRREETRVLKDRRAQLDDIPVDATAPDEPVDVVALHARAAEILDRNRERREAELNTEHEAKEVKRLRTELSKAEARRRHWADMVERLGLPETTEHIEAVIRDADGVNQRVKAKHNYAKLASWIGDQEDVVSRLSHRIEAIDAEKRALLSSAPFPIEGLGIDTEGRVVFGGLPLAQASGAEKLRVSVAIAMAMNPRLRVMLVRDGSLLDAASMKLLGDLARQYDAQVWVERVGDNDAGAVIIEDGAVRGAVIAKEEGAL